MKAGNINVKPLSADLTHNTEFLLKMNPYVIFNFANSEKRTGTSSRKGKNPIWADSLNFYVNGETTMQVKVKDKDLIRDDLVGEALVDIRPAYDKPWAPYVSDFPLFYRQNKPAGSIRLEITFSPANSRANANANTSMQTSVVQPGATIVDTVKKTTVEQIPVTWGQNQQVNTVSAALPAANANIHVGAANFAQPPRPVRHSFSHAAPPAANLHHSQFHHGRHHRLTHHHGHHHNFQLPFNIQESIVMPMGPPIVEVLPPIYAPPTIIRADPIVIYEPSPLRPSVLGNVDYRAPLQYGSARVIGDVVAGAKY